MSHLTSKYKSTPTYTFKSRNTTVTSSNRKEFIPSPFAYRSNSLDMSNEVKPLGKFSKQLKNKDHPQRIRNLPGPGAYESTSSINLGSFNEAQILKKGQPRFYEPNNQTPAPNQYKLVEIKSKNLPKYSFNRSLRSDTDKEESPAPNLYNPNDLNRSTAIKIGNSKRIDNLMPTKSPGPGAYVNEKQFSSNTSFNQRSQILPRARRTNSTQSLKAQPAPNSYEIHSFIDINAKQEKGFTCRGRFSSKQLNGPSPNMYETTNLINKYGPKVGFAKSNRSYLTAELKRSESVPGPGSHQTDMTGHMKFKSLSGSKFSKAKLARLLNSSSHKIAFINPQKLDVSQRSVPKFSIPQSMAREVKKEDSIDKFYDPNYEKIRISHNSFKIPKEKRLESLKKTSIGPGYYNTETITTVTRKIKFPKAQRKTFLDVAIEEKLKMFKDVTYESRQQFPNPPKYMNVNKKLLINDTKIKGY